MNTASALRVENLEVYGLEPVSFHVGRGECVAVSGESGSGKTVLLRAIADLDWARGQVFVGGDERNSMSGPEWRRRVRYSAAEPGWWADTPREHFPQHLKPDEQVESLGLKRAQLDQNIARLSTGERQRMALIRAMIDEPDILLLDEPTGALDAKTTKRAENLIKKFVSDGGSIILVSHDPAQVKRLSGRKLTIRGGKLVGGRK